VHRSKSGILAAVVAAAALLALAGGAGAESPRLVSSPSIVGKAMEGEQLEAQPGAYAGAEPPFSFEYEWQRCNNGGADCIPLGVKGPRYTVTANDIGYRIRTWVSVTGQDCPEWTYNPPPPHRTCVPVTVGVPSELTPVVAANPAFRPQSTAPPTIAGEAEERSTLTAEDGGWTGPQPITTARQWERCDTGGNACVPLPGATAPAYTVTRDDVQHTLRVVVIASNARGSTGPVASAVTGVVRAFLPRAGRTTIGVTLVEAPEKLVIDRIESTPARLTASAPFVLRVRVSDTRGFRIRGAIVRVSGVPARVLAAVPDARTGSDGWARLQVKPGARFVFRRGSALRLLVRAFRPDEGPGVGVATQKPASLPLR
jgi:hypothetical protein